MTIASEFPVRFRQGFEEPVPEVIDAAGDEDDGITNIEVADFATAVEAPAVPRFGGQAHLASLRYPDIACAFHGVSIQGMIRICLVLVRWRSAPARLDGICDQGRDRHIGDDLRVQYEWSRSAPSPRYPRARVENGGH